MFNQSGPLKYLDYKFNNPFNSILFQSVKKHYLTSLAYYLKGYHGETSTFNHSKHTPHIVAHLKSFNFHLKICRFPKGTPMEMNHSDMKISKFSNWLIFDINVGNCLKVMFHQSDPLKQLDYKLKKPFNLILLQSVKKYYLTSFAYYLKVLTW